MKRFAMIGCGFVGARHLLAIETLKGDLVAVCDPHDNMGVLDKYFIKARYFREVERFDRHLTMLALEGNPIDYLVVCSPNYLHDAHVRFGLRLGVNVICEKPIVGTLDNLMRLREVEAASVGKVNVIHQLRTLVAAKAMKRKLAKRKPGETYISVTYHVVRGPWYDYSWKGDESKSGGLAANIGSHLFDLAAWLTGSSEIVAMKLRKKEPRHIHGYVDTDKAQINFDLAVKNTGESYREFSIGDDYLTIDGTFPEDMHIKSYRDIMSGRGVSLNDEALALAVEACEIIRNGKGEEDADSEREG